MERQNETKGFGAHALELLGQYAAQIFITGLAALVALLFSINSRLASVERWISSHDEFRRDYVEEHRHDDNVRFGALYSAVQQNADDIRVLRQQVEDRFNGQFTDSRNDPRWRIKPEN